MNFATHLSSRIGAEQLLQVLNKQLSLASMGAQDKENPQAWTNMVISTLSFTKSIFTVTGKDTGVFMDQWVRQGGHARFRMQFVYDMVKLNLVPHWMFHN